MIRKIFALAAAAVMMLTFAACNDDTEKKDYEYLKTEIVGVWCDEGGPVKAVLNDGEEHYMLYEFTEDGKMYSHAPTAEYAYWMDDTYTIEENYFIVGDAKTLIEIEGDTLIMSNNSGDKRYRRMTVEEVSDYGVYCMGSALWQEQSAYLGLDGNAETTLAVGGAFKE